MAVGRPITIAALLVALTTVLSAAAAAAAGDEPAIVKAFEVEGNNGYTIDVYMTEPRKRDESRLVLNVYDEDSTSGYSAPAKPSKYGIRGDLGPFGHVSVRFHRDGDRWVKSRCSKPRLVATGHYVGEFEFHGEGGYTDFSAQAVRVEPLFRYPDECASFGGGIGSGPGVSLQVLSKLSQTTVVQNRPGGMVRIGAVTGEWVGDVEVEKIVETMAPAGVFNWSPDLSRAALRQPPAPFFGEAVYRHLGGRVTHWTGNLKAEFPGLPPVRLTAGPSYTSFHHGSCRVKGLAPGAPPFDWCRGWP